MIPLESTLTSTLSNVEGSIAMARSVDPDSATAGFFVNTKDNRGSYDFPNNNKGYAVFGNFIYKKEVWTTLLGKVPGDSEVIQPTPPIALQWAYQIK